MKTRELSNTKIILLALFTELALIGIQLINIRIYASNHPDAEAAFTTQYMQNNGFYIFQIIGFFVYVSLVVVIMRKLSEHILNKLLMLVIAGGITELSFYLIINADYKGIFLYSILDKVIATIFGMIIFNYTARELKKPDAYF